MALLLERRFGQFHDSLLTAVELAEQPEHAADFNPEMLAHTRRDALGARAGRSTWREVFNAAPLVRRVSLAVALVGAAAGVCGGAPEALGVWARRNLLLSDELWPRTTHLLVEGFDAAGHVKIARGSRLAAGRQGRRRPGPRDSRDRRSALQHDRRRAGPREHEPRGRGRARRGAVSELRAHVQERAWRRWSFTCAAATIARGPIILDVVDSPTISRMTLHCEYPAYMHREPRDIPVAGLMQLPRGTQITIQAEANKPLVSVQIDDVADENDADHARSLDMAAGARQPADRVSIRACRRSTATRRCCSRCSTPTAFAAARRCGWRWPRSPTNRRRSTCSSRASAPRSRPRPACRPPARCPTTTAWPRSGSTFTSTTRPPSSSRSPPPSTARKSWRWPTRWKSATSSLQPKQKLHWPCRRPTACALEGGPNVGSSQRYVLDVVTPEQLRSMLEARELMLRRRFETIVEELTDTRNLLAGRRMHRPHRAPRTSRQAHAGRQRAGRRRRRRPSESAARAPPRGSCRSSGCCKTASAARTRRCKWPLAFDEIREEMVNNRVDTEELKTRLKDGVADPLKRIVDEMFPELRRAAEAAGRPAGRPASWPAASAGRGRGPGRRDSGRDEAGA